METAFFMLGGIALIGGILVLFDWWVRRKDRQSAHRRSA